MPSARTWVAISLATLALSTVAVSPASAATTSRPQVRSTGDVTMHENGYTTLEVRYKCADGHSASLYADLWQGGTKQNPVSLFTTESPYADIPPLICDGEKHTIVIGLILLGYSEDNPTSDYAFLSDTALGAPRANATVILYDNSTGYRDTDTDKLGVVSR